MRFFLCAVVLALYLGRPAGAEEPTEDAQPIQVDENDWPWWRGPGRNGHANPAQDPPVQWSETENVRWRAAVPGRGHGSACVVGNQVFLTAADKEAAQQMVLCFDRRSGKELWRQVVHKGGFPENGNEKASLASSTPACDGQRLFVNFLNAGAVMTTCLDLQGQQLWQTKISDYVLHQGYGSSPAVYGGLVIVSADNKGGGAIAALGRSSGEVVWRRTRPAKPNYASPIILTAGGREQLIFTGCDLVTSLDPLTGEPLWEIEGATTECVTSAVSDGERIFTSGGYPKNHMAAVAADGSGEIVWENNVRVYVPSMLVADGYLYAVHDSGVATCRRADTGEELWKGRLGGTFSSSPVLVGDRIYACNEEGVTFVFRATPEGYEELARNTLGQSVFATPSICGGQIFLRIAELIDGRRQEFLVCLERTSP